MEEYLLDNRDDVATIHQEWADQLKADNDLISEENVQSIVETGVGKVFVEVLENAGVFKHTDEGQQAFVKFIEKMLI